MAAVPKSRLPKGFQESLFKGQVRRGVGLVGTNFLVLESLVLAAVHLGQVMLLLLSHFSHIQLFVTLWTVAHQAPPSMGFSRQEYWNGVPLPFPWVLLLNTNSCAQRKRSNKMEHQLEVEKGL